MVFLGEFLILSFGLVSHLLPLLGNPSNCFSGFESKSKVLRRFLNRVNHVCSFWLLGHDLWNQLLLRALRNLRLLPLGLLRPRPGFSLCVRSLGLTLGHLGTFLGDLLFFELGWLGHHPLLLQGLLLGHALKVSEF